jgi:hypothetical protein
MMENDVKTWTEMLMNGEMTKLEFEDNVKSQKNLLKLILLEMEGKLLISVDKFTNSVLGLITDTSFKITPF